MARNAATLTIVFTNPDCVKAMRRMAHIIERMQEDQLRNADARRLKKQLKVLRETMEIQKARAKH